MHVTDPRHVDGVIEREFALGEIPGLLWTPASAEGPVPLILLGHPGGLQQMRPRLLQRAQRAAADGFAAATIELPGSGDRPRWPALDEARADLRQALAHGRPDTEIVDRLILPLVDVAAPEWQATADALLELPGLRGPIGYSGGPISVGIRLASSDPRLAAAALFAGSYVPDAVIEEARGVSIPVHVLLQWDDHGNDRDQALRLFDAIGSAEKTLYASLGGHTGVPAHAGDDASRFLARHVR